MQALENFCRSLKKEFEPEIKDTKKPVRYWSEKEVMNNAIVDAFVIVLRTKGCSWAHRSGCTMCGYFNDSSWSYVKDEDLLKQFNTAMKSYVDQKIVKIFNSGSFFDEEEISKNVRDKILEKLVKRVDKISVESRPEFITEESMEEIKEIVGPKTFEVSIGLETSNNEIREKCINKGFTFDDYKRAASIVKKQGFKLKTYVLIKPPFISEKRAIEDAVKTVNDIKNLTDTVSFNPCNVQRNTVVEYLWKRNEYRPPWLFSIVEILIKSKKIKKDIFLKCDVTGGGSLRGPHNCKSCNKIYLEAISKFSLTQDVNLFSNLYCNCKEKWLDQINLEDLSFGSLTNLYEQEMI